MTTIAPLPVHPTAGVAALAVLPSGRIVWPARGAAEDDDGDVGMDLSADNTAAGRAARQKTAASSPLADDDDDDDLDGEPEDGQDDAGEKEEWKPPSREEVERMRQALTDANAEAKKYRLRSRELRGQQRAAQRTVDTSPAGEQTDNAEAIARAKAEAAEDAERRFKPVAVRAAAMAELVKAGFQNPTEGRIDRMVRRLDMDDIDIDSDTGRVTDGLLDQIDDLKADFPELFTPAAPAEVEKPAESRRPRAPRINGADRKTEAPPPKTTGDKIAAGLGLGTYAGRR